MLLVTLIEQIKKNKEEKRKELEMRKKNKIKDY
jgi:hypothetical protein